MSGSLSYAAQLPSHHQPQARELAVHAVVRLGWGAVEMGDQARPYPLSDAGIQHRGRCYCLLRVLCGGIRSNLSQE